MDERPRPTDNKGSLQKVEFVLPILSPTTRRLGNVIPAFCILHALFFVVSLFRGEGSLFWFSTGFGALFSVVTALTIKKMQSSLAKETLIIVFCLCIGIAWLILQQYLLAATLIFIPLILRFSQRLLAVTISSAAVTYPALRMKTAEWCELSNVILKDGMLTIDRLDNKLVQLLVDDTSLNDIDQEMLNQFCAERIKAATTKTTNTVV